MLRLLVLFLTSFSLVASTNNKESALLNQSSLAVEKALSYKLPKEVKYQEPSKDYMEKVLGKTKALTEKVYGKKDSFGSDFNSVLYKKNKSIENKERLSNRHDFYILVSLSLGDVYLKKILNDAQKLRVPVYIKGFYHDLKSTLRKIKSLKGEGAVLIDPKPFNRLSIESVPAFVLKDGETVYVTQGKVSLSYYLEFFKRKKISTSSSLQRFLYKKGIFL